MTKQEINPHTEVRTIQSTNDLAIASFIFALCGFFFILPIVGQILGLIFGFMGMNQIKERNEQGRGLALAAVLISAISLILGLLLIIILIVVAISHADTSYSTSI